MMTFKVFDRDNDGRLTVDELRTVLETMGGKMSAEEVEHLFITVYFIISNLYLYK